ncbi:hypothetical protein [Xylophilus sp. GOD-11R]|uniref:hypothetical protein n=1 Tax=Xylophilus sp. GOD-11R TaxID=3089814 RepID=UPI00298CB14B|nr:hypothetical protein [Xylophilus sp. GOD-11R]WPB55033.1 hypothetical protein R9X41_12720 [Xylophilus sp. GOD-11R]
MVALGPDSVLSLWEQGARLHPLDRAALLCAWARPELPATAIVDLPLGAVTEALLRLRAASFGARIRSRADCRHCGAALELNLACDELLQPSSLSPGTGMDGMRLRPASLRDLAAVADEADTAQAARRLAARCLQPHAGVDEPLDDERLAACEAALDALDPNADIGFDLRCEACGARDSAQLDIGAFLWEEIDARAQSLLWEVHTLARAYGWTESEILALGAARRARYLAMAMST